MLLGCRIVLTLTVINSTLATNCFGTEESLFLLKAANYVLMKKGGTP